MVQRRKGLWVHHPPMTTARSCSSITPRSPAAGLGRSPKARRCPTTPSRAPRVPPRATFRRSKRRVAIVDGSHRAGRLTFGRDTSMPATCCGRLSMTDSRRGSERGALRMRWLRCVSASPIFRSSGALPLPLGPWRLDAQQLEDALLSRGQRVELWTVVGVGEIEALEGGEDVRAGRLGEAAFGQ